ncbi:carbon monoxide dehydrogenase subunit G [Sulfobacillus acidophilus DSM 10332]|uniref:Carbon monoxide dehydrogenase subunit G n=1 Tax=Sulfobacillus acidophilus (strain ATCC 700253 / DSM 10332 / NAL) TaxID=679936 RepID=G8TYS1_SULAD|nr:carbon monoxide dehydrogenase subunit G [Sulfobacillus acidophilus DSM 10332]
MKSYQGAVTIDAPVDVVWDFVRNPDAIGACMPDVVEYHAQDGHHLTAKVRVGVGPVRAIFDLSAEVRELSGPRQARLAAKGGGMGSGFQLVSDMTVKPDDAQGTRLEWVAEVTVSGPLATLGGRVLDNQVKRITEQVFENIRKGVAAQSV